MAASRKTTRVFCVDRSPMIIEGLRSVLEQSEDFEFTGSSTDTEGLVRKLRDSPCQITLLDPGHDLSVMEEVIKSVKENCPHTNVVIFADKVLDHCVNQALWAGAVGYILKDMASEEILGALRETAKGNPSFCPETSKCFDPKTKKPRLSKLTSREQQVLQLIGKGMSRDEIAKHLSRSPKTIDAHRASIMERLDIHERVDLVRFTIREGLVEA